ncbi:Ger(x)C family spore germination protein [Radiobacillus sp. PE A8.2]|uniref:Ger(x)C family spore germination protein n=1 Tax=Radiobacillus sp. PE A8.2 TaxID=3380349 RepID=UPI00388E104A
MKRLLYLIPCFVLLLGSACVQKEILDDVRLSTAVGYEFLNGDESLLQSTSVVPTYKPDKSVSSDIFVETGPLSKYMRSKLNMQSSKPFVSGKIEITLYSKEIAQQGLINYLDTLYRDPSVGSRVFITVVDGDVKSLLEQQLGQEDNGTYLANMLQQNIEIGSLPRTNLHEFMSSYYEEGKDPFLPLLTKEKNKVTLNGNALFKKDKMVGKIELENMFTFKALMDAKSLLDSVLVKVINEDDEEEKYAGIFKVNSKRKYHILNPKSDTPTVNIIVNMNATVREYSEGKVNSKIIKQIEESAKKQMEKQGDEMIANFQNLGIDPLGIGQEIKTRNRKWNEEKWDAIYPNLEINLKFNIKITENGVVQ